MHCQMRMSDFKSAGGAELLYADRQVLQRLQDNLELARLRT